MSAGVAVFVLFTGAIVAACYDVPRPDCGFQCGPNAECPDGYTCAADQRCHRIGAPSGLVCDPSDAAVDSALDAPPP
jgi:hypothetical protein